MILNYMHTNDWLTVIFLIVGSIFGLIILIFDLRASSKRRKRELDVKIHKVRRIYNHYTTFLATNYGEPSLIIDESQSIFYHIDLSKHITFFDNHQIVCIGGRPMRYIDIVDYKITTITNTVSETKSSISSAIGMGIVGGVLFGGPGAIVGGLSGVKETKTSEYIIGYKFMIILNDMTAPYFIVELQYENNALKLDSALLVIIERNRRNMQIPQYGQYPYQQMPQQQMPQQQIPPQQPPFPSNPTIPPTIPPTQS